jgi:hypothetical protein
MDKSLANNEGDIERIGEEIFADFGSGGCE